MADGEASANPNVVPPQRKGEQMTLRNAVSFVYQRI